MKPLSPDTTPQIQRKHYELMRKLSPEPWVANGLQLAPRNGKAFP